MKISICLIFAFLILLFSNYGIQLVSFAEEAQVSTTTNLADEDWVKKNIEVTDFENVWQLKVDSKKYDVLYSITGGTIQKIDYSHTLTIHIWPTANQGKLIIHTPKVYLFSSDDNCFRAHYATSGGERGSFPFFDNQSYLSYEVTFEKTSPIIVIGSKTSFIPDGSTCYNILSWTKNDAKLWHDGIVSDEHFRSMIQDLIAKQLGTIIKEENTDTNDTEGQKSSLILSDKIIESIIALNKQNEDTTEIHINTLPQWVKIPVNWWNKEMINDDEFFSSIGYLIDNQIIQFKIISKYN